MTSSEDKKTATGVVEEVLPNSLFRVRLSAAGDSIAPTTTESAESPVSAEQPLILAYLAGKMRLNRIRVLMGDQVEMILDPYGGRARIVRRLT